MADINYNFWPKPLKKNVDWPKRINKTYLSITGRNVYQVPTLILLPWRAAKPPKRVALKYIGLDVIHILEPKLWSNLKGCARIYNQCAKYFNSCQMCQSHLFQVNCWEIWLFSVKIYFVWTFGPFDNRHFIKYHHILQVIKRLLALYCWLYVLLGLCELISFWYGQLRIV